MLPASIRAMGQSHQLVGLFVFGVALCACEVVDISGPKDGGPFGGLEFCEFDGGLGTCGTPPGPSDCDAYADKLEIASWGGFRNDNLNNPQATAGILVVALRLLPETNPGTDSDWYLQPILERLSPGDPANDQWFDDVDAEHQPGGPSIAACANLNPDNACSNGAASLFRTAERGRPVDYDGDGDPDLLSARNVFYDIHGSLGARNSLLAGEGLSQCKVACEQSFVCSNDQAAIGASINGTFRIWEVFEAVNDGSVPGGVRTDVYVYMQRVGENAFISNF